MRRFEATPHAHSTADVLMLLAGILSVALVALVALASVLALAYA